jgi:hypothetical protein
LGSHSNRERARVVPSSFERLSKAEGTRVAPAILNGYPKRKAQLGRSFLLCSAIQYGRYGGSFLPLSLSLLDGKARLRSWVAPSLFARFMDIKGIWESITYCSSNGIGMLCFCSLPGHMGRARRRLCSPRRTSFFHGPYDAVKYGLRNWVLGFVCHCCNVADQLIVEGLGSVTVGG